MVLVAVSRNRTWAADQSSIFPIHAQYSRSTLHIPDPTFPIQAPNFRSIVRIHAERFERFDPRSTFPIQAPHPQLHIPDPYCHIHAYVSIHSRSMSWQRTRGSVQPGRSDVLSHEGAINSVQSQQEETRFTLPKSLSHCEAMANVSTAVVRLSSGADMPLLGLGTWKSQPGEVRAAVEAAITAGYRHVDGAFAYENEAEVGAAVNSCIANKVASREQLFIASKLWGKYHAPADVKVGFMKTLTDLKLDYLDLFLMHSPMAFKNEGDGLWPEKDGKVLVADVDYVDTWKAMEALVKEGLVKSIGVSNFNAARLQRLLAVATIKPVVNQVELHPYLPQQELIEFCQSKNIVLTAYSPFGSPDRPFKNTQNDPCSLLQDSVVAAIGNKHGKTSAQVLIRYHTQRNIVVIPKSITPSRIVQNAQTFDFTLDGEDMKKLEGLRRDWRACDWNPALTSIHPNYPFDN